MLKRMLGINLSLIGTALLICVVEMPAPAQSAPPSAQEANALFEAKKWPEAAQAYEAITKAEPNNGRAWFRLGTSLYSLGKYEQAASAFERAAELLNFQLAMYNAAASYMHLNNKPKAYEWLERAADAGFALPDLLNQDQDFASLRREPRYSELVKRIAVNAAPCTNIPEYRQLDFWIGEWNILVQQPGAPPASSSVQSIISSCVIFENFTQGAYSGKSFSYYDAAIGKWRQTWVDSTGGSAYYVGEYKDGAMRFEGETHPRVGKAVKVRMTFFNLGPERVRQLGEMSDDNGETWKVRYDLTYVRKK